MNTYNITEFAKLLGVAVITLQRWDREGRLKALRTPSNRRLYTDEHLRQARGLPPQAGRLTIAYARVSSQAQKPDLENQVRVLEDFCAANGWAVDQWVKEVGGGLNFKRPKFLNLIDLLTLGRAGRVVVAHRDRLARFGYDLLEHLCKVNGCDLVVMNQESLSPEQEIVQDLLAIVHCFSARLYGLRNYRKALRELVLSLSKEALAVDEG